MTTNGNALPSTIIRKASAGRSPTPGTSSLSSAISPHRSVRYGSMAFDPALEAAMRTGMGPAWYAADRPDTPAIIAPTGDRSYADLNANANRLVRALRGRGLAAGDSVAILCSNRAEF